MSVSRKMLQRLDHDNEKKRLEKKLENLKQRRQQLLSKLGQTRQRVSANSRQSDKKFRENKARAISMRTKKSDQAMLRTVDTIIRMTEKKLKKLA